MHPSKRRKTENVSSALTKPFRSPIKRSAEASEASNIRTRCHDANTGTTTTYQPSEPVSDTASPIDLVPKSADDLKTLQTEYKTLSKQLKELRQTLDTVDQARRIATSAQDSRINSLVTSWRSVARDAAEELFEAYQERVRTEGGVEAWSKNNENHKPSWMDDSQHGLSKEHKELLAHQKAEDDQLASKYNLVADTHSDQEQAQVRKLLLSWNPLMHSSRIAQWM